MIYKKEQNVIFENTSFLETNIFKSIDDWKTHNENHTIQKYKSSSLTEEEYDRIKDYIDIMKNTEDYKEYKIAFDRLCYFCHIVPRGVIIRKCEIIEGSMDRNHLYMEYTYNTKKIELPEEVILYHMSKVDGIKELNPSFRSKPALRKKAARGFFYDKPRVYFTIRKNMPKFLADYNLNEKVHMYICKQKINSVYVDPLVWSPLQGAVYVETNKPIKVEKVNSNIINNLLSKCKSIRESSGIDFDDFYKFISEIDLL